MRLLNKLHIKTRSIQLYNIDKQGSNHIAAEVYFNNKWNYFDITWGTIFPLHSNEGSNSLGLMSIKDLFQSKHPYRHAITNRSNLSFLVGTVPNPFYYLKSKRVNLVINGSGIIDLYPVKNKNGLVNYFPKNLPNYFGSYLFDVAKSLPPHKASITYILKNLPPSDKFIINVTYNTCPTGSKVILTASNKRGNPKAFVTQLNATSLKKGNSVISSKKLHLIAGSTLKISTITKPKEFCYIAIKKFTFIR